MTEGAAAARRAALLADIGGTNARFTLRLDDGAFTPVVTLPSVQFHDLRAAATESLSLLWKPLPFAVSVREAAVAVAGPVTGDVVELTNVAWRFSIEETRRALGLDRLVAMNDLAAVAWAIPVLGADGTSTLLEAESERQDERQGERRKASIEGKDGRQDERQDERREAFIEGKGESRSDGGAVGGEVAAVVGVGTGLGVATWACSAEGGAELVLASEGGHRDLAATNEREWLVVERLRARFGEHVSVERAVSGQGLANLWTALAELDGETGESLGAAGAGRALIRPEEVSARAAAGEARAVEALGLFAGWLGAFAGDLALTVGARRGVWIGGGLLGAIDAAGATLDRARLRRRFVDKGRFEGWLDGVPVREIGDPLAAFRGLGRALGAGAPRRT